LGIQLIFRRNKGTVNEQKAHIMNLSSKDNVKPEQVTNSELEADLLSSAQVSANALVMRRFQGFRLQQHDKSDLEYLSEWIDLKTSKSDETATMIIEKITEMQKQRTGYKAVTQTNKNIAWFLPRPKKDRYKGGKPLYCEEWLIELAKDILKTDLNLLNLFCGMNKYGFRIDINEEVNPTMKADAHSFTETTGMKVRIANKGKFNCIIADPPYSTEEARDIYGTPPLKYKKWTAECDKVLEEGGLLMVYHKYVMPNPNPEKYVVVKRIFIGNRTMHLPRVCIVFQKKWTVTNDA
jgi:hypothetical protein